MQMASRGTLTGDHDIRRLIHQCIAQPQWLQLPLKHLHLHLLACSYLLICVIFLSEATKLIHGQKNLLCALLLW